MAFPIGVRVLPGYPNQVGIKNQIVFDRTGPTSYVQYVPSTNTGGDVMSASSGGLNFGGFDNIDDTSDDTGQVQVFAVMALAGYGNAVPTVTLRYFSLVTATLGGKAQTAGTEIVAATNLSTFSFRFEAYMI